MAYPRDPGEFAARWNVWSEEHRARWLSRRIADTEEIDRLRLIVRRAQHALDMEESIDWILAEAEQEPGGSR